MLSILPKKHFLSKGGKQKLSELATPAILLVVGLGAFGLGRLSALSEREKNATVTPPSVQSAGEKKFVASKSGTKYYAAGCAGASRIKPENEVWFASAAEAQAQGYTEAANCNR